MPLGVFAGAQNLISEINSESDFLEDLEEIKSLLASSQNRNLEAVRIIQNTLDEIRNRYGINISIKELSEETKAYLSRMGIDINKARQVLDVLDNFETTKTALAYTSLSH